MSISIWSLVLSSIIISLSTIALIQTDSIWLGALALATGLVLMDFFGGYSFPSTAGWSTFGTSKDVLSLLGMFLIGVLSCVVALAFPNVSLDLFNAEMTTGALELFRGAVIGGALYFLLSVINKAPNSVFSRICAYGTMALYLLLDGKNVLISAAMMFNSYSFSPKAMFYLFVVACGNFVGAKVMVFLVGGSFAGKEDK